jgi:hypothetical protein
VTAVAVPWTSLGSGACSPKTGNWGGPGTQEAGRIVGWNPALENRGRHLRVKPRPYLPGVRLEPTCPGGRHAPALGGFSLSASLSMKGTRNRLTSESRKSGGSPGKMLHCNMDRVPGGESVAGCRHRAAVGGVCGGK